MDKKSLLSVGVVALDGSFESGDVVSIADKDACEFARGKVCFSSKHLDRVKGRRSDKEVIHCDNIVILS
jgi:glutamate 5-kinase